MSSFVQSVEEDEVFQGKRNTFTSTEQKTKYLVTVRLDLLSLFKSKTLLIGISTT